MWEYLQIIKHDTATKVKDYLMSRKRRNGLIALSCYLASMFNLLFLCIATKGVRIP